MKHNMVKIDKQNPMLIIRPDIRKLLVLRRSVHKLYDMVQTDKWESLVNTATLKEYTYLLLRDCYMPLDLLCEPKRLKATLLSFKKLLKDHLIKSEVSVNKSFNDCDYCVLISPFFMDLVEV